MNMDQDLRFRADQVTFSACDDENIAHVYLCSAALPQQHYLMISRCLGSRTKGGVFLEYDDQSQAAQGGVLGYQLQNDRLTLEIERKAAESLGVPEVRRIVVEFELAPASLPELHRALAAIFAGS